MGDGERDTLFYNLFYPLKYPVHFTPRNTPCPPSPPHTLCGGVRGDIRGVWNVSLFQSPPIPSPFPGADGGIPPPHTMCVGGRGTGGNGRGLEEGYAARPP